VLLSPCCLDVVMLYWALSNESWFAFVANVHGHNLPNTVAAHADDAWQGAADGEVEVPAVPKERGVAEHPWPLPGRRLQCSSSLCGFEQRRWAGLRTQGAANVAPCELISSSWDSGLWLL
jgi:hypothetical protein